MKRIAVVNFMVVLCMLSMVSCTAMPGMGEDPEMESPAYVSAPVRGTINPIKGSTPKAGAIVALNSKLQTTNVEQGVASEENSARVRIGMYESVPGYSVMVTRVRVRNIKGEAMPAFGNNLEGAAVSPYSFEPTYDTTSGAYAWVADGTEMQLALTFDAVLTSEDSVHETIRLTDVVVLLDETPITSMAGCTYEKTVRLTAELLDLHVIEFDATVVETEEGAFGE